MSALLGVNRSGEMGSEDAVAIDTSRRWFTPVRQAAPLESLAHIYHKLGLHSNIIVSASYRQMAEKPEKLSKSVLYPALKEVIKKHAALAVIGISETNPSRKGGKTKVWEAMVDRIDFFDCVEFIESTKGTGEESMLKFFERKHNDWLWASDCQDQDDRRGGAPWWRVYVIDGQRVVFLYHHFIADGISGYVFHRSLLEELNKFRDVRGDLKTDTMDSIMPISRVELPPKAVDLIKIRLSMSYVVLEYLFWLLVRVFVPKNWLLFSDAIHSKAYPTPKNPRPYKSPTETRLVHCQISNENMASLISQCRENKTTFTALLHTIVQVTLAVDLYPDSKIGFSRMAVNLRPVVRNPEESDVMVNDGADLSLIHLLRPYREAGTLPPSVPKCNDTNTREPHLNPDAVWRLAQSCKRQMNRSIYSTKTVLHNFISSRLMGQHEEDFIANGFGALGMYQHNSFLLSNLGMFRAQRSKGDTWMIEDISFSSAAMKASIGNAGFVINVASVENGMCNLHVNFEGGVLQFEVAKRFINGIKQRLETLSTMG